MNAVVQIREIWLGTFPIKPLNIVFAFDSTTSLGIIVHIQHQQTRHAQIMRKVADASHME